MALPKSSVNVGSCRTVQDPNVNGQLQAIRNRLSALESYVNNTLNKYVNNGDLAADIAEQIKTETVYATTVISNTVVTESLYATYGDIAELTVDSLMSINKVDLYWAGDTSAANFIKIQDQTAQWITGSTDASTTQLTDRDGNKLFYKTLANASNYKTAGISTTPTAWPVTVYLYTELVKGVIGHIYNSDSGEYEFQIKMGAGTGTGDYGKFIIRKHSTGVSMTYITESGDDVPIEIGDDGITAAGLDVCETAKNAGAVEIDSTGETAIVEKSLTTQFRSKLVVSFSAELVISGGAANVTAKTYIGSTALSFQPKLYCGAEQSYILSYNDVVRYQDAGVKTVLIKLITDANAANISVGNAVLIVQAYPDPLPDILPPTGLTASVISSSEIDLSWTNPTSEYFIKTEVYASKTNLTDKDRDYCVANASLIYSGSAGQYANTGLSSSTKYYYRLFAKYTIEGTSYFSSGVNGNATTLAPQYQAWSGYPSTPDLTTSYPYQYIMSSNGYILLIVSTQPYYHTSWLYTQGTAYRYTYRDGAWTERINVSSWGLGGTPLQANNPIYTDATYTTIYFDKTTT